MIKKQFEKAIQHFSIADNQSSILDSLNLFYCHEQAALVYLKKDDLELSFMHYFSCLDHLEILKNHILNKKSDLKIETIKDIEGVHLQQSYAEEFAKQEERIDSLKHCLILGIRANPLGIFRMAKELTLTKNEIAKIKTDDLQSQRKILIDAVKTASLNSSLTQFGSKKIASDKPGINEPKQHKPNTP